jgi:hypothetical protein
VLALDVPQIGDVGCPRAPCLQLAGCRGASVCERLVRLSGGECRSSCRAAAERVMWMRMDGGVAHARRGAVRLTGVLLSQGLYPLPISVR